MKSFKDMLSEVAQPNDRGAEEEQAFKDQHTVEVIPHPVALDHQFTGEIGKDHAHRDADQHGSANYDTAYAYGMNSVYDKAFATEDLDENAAEEVPMMSQQLDFIAMAAKAIKASLAGTDPEEWYQGKLGTAHDAMKTLHANIKGSVDESEMATKSALSTSAEASKEGKKKVTLKKAPWDKNEELVGGQKKLDHDKDGDIDGADFAALRAKKKNKKQKLAASYGEEVELDEAQIDKMKFVSKGFSNRKAADRHNDQLVGSGKASQKSYVYKHKDNKFYVADMKEDLDEAHPEWDVTFKSNGHKPQKVKARNTAEAIRKASKKAQAAHSQPKQIPDHKTVKKVSESVEELAVTNESIIEMISEAAMFKANASIKLKDGKTVKLDKAGAEAMTDLFKGLSAGSRKSMTASAMKDTKSFNEVLDLAKEAS